MYKMLLILIYILVTILPSKGTLISFDDDDNVLHIGAIFPIAGEGGWQGGQVTVSL